MQRKLIQQGPGSLTVYLPKKWIETYDLKKGEFIEMNETDGKLIISNVLGNKKKSETTIKLYGLNESLIRILIGNTYRLGFDRITVEFDDESQFKILQEIINKRIIGFEIVKKEHKRCIVENVTEPDKEQFANIMQKLFINIDTLLDSVKIFCSRNKSKLSEDIDELEDRIIKYDNFCRRILLKKRIESKESLHLAFLTMLIHAQREIYYLIKNLEKVSSTISYSKDTLIIIEELITINKEIQEAYLKKNQEIIAKINKLGRDLIYKKGYDAIQKSKGKETIALYHLLASARDYYQSTSPLSGLLM